MNQLFFTLKNSPIDAKLLLSLVSLLLASCSSYHQNIMFTLPEGTAMNQQVTNVEKNYTIQKND
ncbi:MAG TPA: hypothetical protein VK666_30990, partial [Chryseolinea sp.]|nr:hypothetical protein [Chryseolinea sp.]